MRKGPRSPGTHHHRSAPNPPRFPDDRGGAAENAQFVLDNRHVDLVDVEEVSRNPAIPLRARFPMSIRHGTVLSSDRSPPLSHSGLGGRRRGSLFKVNGVIGTRAPRTRDRNRLRSAMIALVERNRRTRADSGQEERRAMARRRDFILGPTPLSLP